MYSPHNAWRGWRLTATGISCSRKKSCVPYINPRHVLSIRDDCTYPQYGQTILASPSPASTLGAKGK